MADNTRRETGISRDRSDRITIEELVDGDDQPISQPPRPVRESKAAERLRLKRQQRQQVPTVRSYLAIFADTAQKRAAAHPVTAAVIGTFTLPFIGLAVSLHVDDSVVCSLY